MKAHVLSFLCLTLATHAWIEPIRFTIKCGRRNNAQSRLYGNKISSILDDQLGIGYLGTGDDWSHAASSNRPDRPLNNEQLRIFNAKSDIAGLRQLGLQLSQIIAATFLISSTGGLGITDVLFRTIGTALMGFGLVTIGHCAQHECIHNTAFKSQRLNVIVSWLVSLPRLTNPRWERMLHKDHHTYTNDPLRDPELLAGSPSNALPDSFASYVKKILRIGGGKFGLGVWSARVAILWAGANGRVVGYSGFDPVPKEKAEAVRAGLATSCRLQLAFYATILLFVMSSGSTAWNIVFKYWMLPMLIGEPMHAFFHIADHLNCEHDYTAGADNTRTTIAPGFVRFNMWNMNYHAVHHLYPSIPFHQLPAVHKVLQENGPVPHFTRISPSAFDMHKQLLTRWIPHYQNRLAEKGIAGVEVDWIPCSPDRVSKA